MLKLLGSGEYAVELPEPTGRRPLRPGRQRVHAFDCPPTGAFRISSRSVFKAALNEEPAAYTDDELREFAAHCTVQEKNATKVERQVRKAATALLLIKRIGQQFNGVVTGASEKGTWVRISEPIAEGKVVKGSAGLDVGDRVRVELVHVDPERGFIDFARR